MVNRMGTLQKPRISMQRSQRVLPVMLSGLLIGLTACSGGGLQGERIAQAIQDDVIKQGGTSLKAVTCPKEIKPEVGSTFDCIGEIDTGYTFTIPVKQNDDKGNVVWDVPNAKGLLNVPKLQTLIQEALQSELGARPVVECGGTYKPIKAGQTFDCKLDYKKPDPKQDAKDGKTGDKPAADIATAQSPAKTAPDQAAAGNAEADKNSDKSEKGDKSGKPGKGKAEKILVTIDPQGNLSWQRVLPDSGKKVAAVPGAATKPGEQATAAPSSAAAAAAPPAQANADDFLNQAGATDSIED